MKKTLLCLLACALFPTLVGAQPADEIVLGAWNIEWLGRPDMRSGPSKDVAQLPEDLARYIGDSGVDMLALEEICILPGQDLHPFNPTLQSALHLLNQQPGQRWKVEYFPKKGEEPTQWTALAWNAARVQAVGGPYRIPVELPASEFNLWKRWPYAMKFTTTTPGHTDWVAVPIHMKSNRRDEPGDNPVRQRAQEGRALARQLPGLARQFGDRDLLVLGDTNVLKASEGALTALEARGLVNLNRADRPTTWKGRAPFDRIFVPGDQPEFAGCRQTIFKPEGMTAEEFKVKLSDHYMVTTRFRPTRDDD